jgi:uncharacterized protein YacL
MFFRHEHRYVLDSSSIIDGRVIQLFSRKFLEGKVIIPQLALSIVQQSAGDRGERAISILKRNAQIEYSLNKCQGLAEEECVLRCAQKKHAKVITTSDEVCRQAKNFAKVTVIDIRDMYRALTPIFKPNTIISVKILKRGLSHTEGVGYIEGIKIVVENGAKYLNQTVLARVTNMLSLETGNLVFCTVENSKNGRPVYMKSTRGQRG